MQATLENLFQDKTKTFETKRSFLQTILTNIKDPNSKLGFIKTMLNFLISLEDTLERLKLIHYLLTYIQENAIECYTADEIKTTIEQNDDLVHTVLFINAFVKTCKDRTKIFQMKNLFLKNVRKDESFWLTEPLKEFFTKKTSLEAQNSNTAPAPVLLSGFDYERHAFQINIIFYFFLENPSFYPSNFDAKEVLLKWLLTIKAKTDLDKRLQSGLIEQLLNICRTNQQFYLTCFKLMIKALKFTYTNSDSFECHYSAYNFLEQTDPQVINELMKSFLVGEAMMNVQDWLKIFRNLVRVGLSENIGVTFLSLSRGFENMRAYEVLLRVQEDITPIVILPLKFEKWQKSALDILIFFILQGPINTVVVNKILPKLFTVAKEICKTNISQFSTDLTSFLYHLKVKYTQSSLGDEIDKEYTKFLEECKVDPMRLDLQRYSTISWTSSEAQKMTHNKQKSLYRGLVNLGNTCYMNSFVQALYMTKLFRYRILAQGELVQKMYSGTELKEIREATTDANVVQEKKKAVSLFQLQKLFAFMTASEREAIAPGFLKATLPGHFKVSHSQEDSSEFGRIYLDDLEKNLVNTEEKDLVKELFTGEIVSYITCQQCNEKYRKVENFMDLSLNFESRDPQKSYDLVHLVEKNFEPIEFKDDNKYFCEKCQKHTDLAIKTHYPTRMPPILILTINRFYFDPQTFQRVKILSHVDILEEIVLHQENETGIQEEIIYDLYAIVVHRGMTLDYGHYYCTAKEKVEEKVWTLFDDSNTMSLEKLDPFEYVKTNKQDAPYILFYQARDYFGSSMARFSEFKLSTALKKIVEQDNVSYLKEIDQNAKLAATITALNVPMNIMRGPDNFKKDEDEDGNGFSNGFGANKFIM